MLTKKRFRWLVALVAILASVSLVASACGGRENTSGGGQQAKKIKIAYNDWDENIAMSNLFKAVLETKGYQVELQQLDAGVAYSGLSQGSVDLWLDAWLPETHKEYWDKYKDKLEDLGTWYTGKAAMYIAVPQYVSEINTIDDLKTHADKIGGKITGLGPDAGETRIINQKVIPTLDGKVKQENSSSTAMLASLDSAIKEKKPIAVALWTPHWAYTRYQLKNLQDPKKLMGEGEEIKSVGRQGFAKDFPQLADAAKKMKVSDQQLGSLEDAIQKAGTGKELDAAKQWAAKPENKAFVDQLFAGVS